MDFHEVRFPASLSFGSSGGPERHTDVVTLANGFEERNTPWQHSRRSYEAGLAIRSLNDIETVIAFFEARQGRLYGFRWKDWADYKSCAPLATPGPDDQEIGTGDGVMTDFQLSKTYQSGGIKYDRPIRKPVAGTVRIAVSGSEQQEGTDFQVDQASGLVSLSSPPGIGVTVTAGFEFDVPVRFDSDRFQVSLASFQAGEIPSLPVVELRL